MSEIDSIDSDLMKKRKNIKYINRSQAIDEDILSNKYNNSSIVSFPNLPRRAYSNISNNLYNSFKNDIDTSLIPMQPVVNKLNASFLQPVSRAESLRSTKNPYENANRTLPNDLNNNNNQVIIEQPIFSDNFNKIIYKSPLSYAQLYPSSQGAEIVDLTPYQTVITPSSTYPTVMVPNLLGANIGPEPVYIINDFNGLNLNDDALIKILAKPNFRISSRNKAINPDNQSNNQEKDKSDSEDKDNPKNQDKEKKKDEETKREKALKDRSERKTPTYEEVPNIEKLSLKNDRKSKMSIRDENRLKSGFDKTQNIQTSKTIEINEKKVPKEPLYSRKRYYLFHFDNKIDDQNTVPARCVTAYWCLRQFYGCPCYIWTIFFIFILAVISILIWLSASVVYLKDFNNSYFVPCKSNADCNINSFLHCAVEKSACLCPAEITTGRCDCSPGYFWNGTKCSLLMGYKSKYCADDFNCDPQKMLVCINQTCQCDFLKTWNPTLQMCDFIYSGCYNENTTVAVFQSQTARINYFVEICIDTCNKMKSKYALASFDGTVNNCYCNSTYLNSTPTNCEIYCPGSNSAGRRCGSITNNALDKAIYQIY